MIYSTILCSVILFATFMGVNTQNFKNNNKSNENPWIRLGRTTGTFLQNCWPQNSKEEHQRILLLRNCFKQKILIVLNRILQCDVIELLDGVEFVKIKDSNGSFSRKMESIRSLQEKPNWTNSVLNKIDEVFQTYILKIRLDRLLRRDIEIDEARHRHHRRGNMFTSLMMFGGLAMGMLLIPMGFKFLTILGAKALLLAKMALILTSIQGLKKVATSGLNYGFYHSPNPWHHDRHGLDEVPDEQLDYLHHKHVRS